MDSIQENKFSQLVQKGDGSALLQLMADGYSFADAVLLEEDIKKLKVIIPELTRKNEDLNKIIALLLEVDNACFDQGLNLYAQDVNRLSEELLDRFPEKESSEFKILKSKSLKLKARVQWELMQEEDARNCLERAHKIQEELLRVEPGNYKFLKDLGDLHKYLGDFRVEDYIEHYRRYYEIAKGLTERFPEDDSVKDNYSIAIERMAGQDKYSGDYRSAERRYHQYLDIQEEIHRRDSEHPKFLNCLSIANGRLAGLHKMMGNFENAEVYYKKEVSILSRLYDMYPRRFKYKRNLAHANSAISKLYIVLDEYDKALEYIAVSYRLWDEIKDVSQDPWEDIQSYYHVLETLGYIYWKRGDAEESREHFEQFLEQAEELHKRFPDIGSIKDDVGRGYQHMGGYYSGQEEYEKALENFAKFRDISKERYDEHDGKAYLNNYAFSLGKMAGVYSDQFKHEEAEALYKEEQRLREEMCSLYPKSQEYRDLLGIALYHRGMNAAEMESHEIAQKALEAAYVIMKEITDAGQKDYGVLLQNIEIVLARVSPFNGEVSAISIEQEKELIESDREGLMELIEFRDRDKNSLTRDRQTLDIYMEVQDLLEEHEDDYDQTFFKELLAINMKACAELIQSKALEWLEIYEIGAACEIDAKEYCKNDEEKKEMLGIAMRAYERKRKEGTDDGMIQHIERVKRALAGL